MKENPAQTEFNAAINDGYRAGHCTCEKYRAWDDPMGNCCFSCGPACRNNACRPAITMPCAKAPMKTTTRHTLVACSAALLLASLATLHAAETNSTTTTAQIANGLAPEVTDLSPKSVSWAQEAKLPDLDKAFISTAPADRKDGIPVGQLGNKEAILVLAAEIAAGKHGEIDSLLLSHHGKLLFESYYRRGRINYPHYQMSITKSYTAMAIGRAIQLGYLTMADLDKPVVVFFKTLEPGKLVPGTASITLAQAMNMRSGIRLEDGKAKELLKQPGKFKGQGQVRLIWSKSSPFRRRPTIQVPGSRSGDRDAGA